MSQIWEICFFGCSQLSSLDVSGFDTGNVTTMWRMFRNCSQLSSLDVSGFDTKNVTSMGDMFYGCSQLASLDVSGFDTSRVTTMGSMFNGCSCVVSLDISNFHTANVTNMGGMFQGCLSLQNDFDLSSWNIANVTDFSCMFLDCGSPKIIMPGTNTIATAIGSMFLRCNASEINISGITGKNITAVYNMFHGMTTPKTIDISNFTFENVTNSSNFISYGSGPNDKIYVKDAAAQQFVLENR